MTTTLDVRFRALALDGTLTLDVDSVLRADGGPAYEVVTLDEPGISWRRQSETSPFVDGAVEAGSVRDVARLTVVIRCLGATGQEVNQRRAALTDAVAGSPWWLCEVTLAGVRSTWKANRADWAVGTDPFELMARPLRRLVTLTIPVQPSRAVTYV